MLCGVFLLEAVLISVGNLLTFVVFASEKPLRKKSLLLVINMAFADAILEAVSAFVCFLMDHAQFLVMEL